MEVSGYQIREAMNRFELRAKTAEQQFKESLYAFEGDEVVNPTKIADTFQWSQEAVCALQVLRSRFNLQTKVSVVGVPIYKQISLALAVKLVGPADRLAKMWRDAITHNGRDRWSMTNTLQRTKDSVYAKRTISIEQINKFADQASSVATALRSAIAEGNAQKIRIGEGTEFTNLPKLFE
jgi:hypothetical protein